MNIKNVKGTDSNFSLLQIYSESTTNPPSTFYLSAFSESQPTILLETFFYPQKKCNPYELHVEIYDRWGVLINIISSINEGWDGKSKSGQMVTDGTYYYIFTATGLDGKMYSTNGFVMLLQ